MAQFLNFIPILQAVEGGFQKLPSDKGNYNSLGQLVGTNHGISAKLYEQLKGYPPSEETMKKITKQEAQNIYKTFYWNAVKGDFIENQSVANIIADHAVNAGVGSAGELVQQVLRDRFNTNTVSSKIDSSTVTSINSMDPYKLHEYIKDARISFYKDIGGVFLKGWLKRLESFVFEKKK